MADSNPLIPRVNIINATPDTQLITLGTFTGSTTGVIDVEGIYAEGCILQDLTPGAGGDAYKNQGTTDVPDFQKIDMFSGVLPALASGKMWLGDSLGDAQAVDLSGDATIDDTGVVTVSSMTDSNGNIILDTAEVASAVNNLRVTNAAVGTSPSLSAVGSDTNIDVKLTPKGTGNVQVALGKGVKSSVSNGLAGFKVNAAPQSISGPGAVTLTQYLTQITTTGADAFTLADGTIVGMLKKIKFIVDGGDATLTPTHLAGGTTITFSVVGDWVELMWNGTTWTMIDSGSVLGTAVTPVLA